MARDVADLGKQGALLGHLAHLHLEAHEPEKGVAILTEQLQMAQV